MSQQNPIEQEQEAKKPLLSRDLKILLVSMIFANIGGNMMMPLLAVYLTNLGAGIGEVGLFFTLSSVFPLLIQILGGWLSDSIGRLRAIAIGSLGGLLGYLPYLFATSYWWLLSGEALFSVARSLVGPSFAAFTAEESDDKSRGQAFGSTQTIFLIVNVIGPAMGGWLAQEFGFRMMFAVSASFYLAATVIRLGMARRLRTRAVAAASGMSLAGFKRQLGGIAALVLAGGVITWFLIIDGVADVSFRMSFDLLPVYLKDIGGLSVSQIGMLGSLVGVAAMLTSPLGGYLSDHFSERLSIALGFGAASASFGVLLLSDGLLGYALAWTLFGVSWGLSGPAFHALISKTVPKNLLGTAFGFFDTSVGFASLPAPWLGSQLWQRISPQAPFFITMLISTLTIVPAWIKFKLNVDSEPSEAERGPSVAQSTAS